MTSHPRGRRPCHVSCSRASPRTAGSSGAASTSSCSAPSRGRVGGRCSFSSTGRARTRACTSTRRSSARFGASASARRSWSLPTAVRRATSTTVEESVGGSYILDEVIPQAAERYGADAKRVAIGGISMGGFGALHLGRIAPDRFCAVGGHSPALWRLHYEAPRAAFDDAADFARHDLLSLVPNGRAAPYGRAPLWIDVGRQDPFLGTATAVRRPRAGPRPGGQAAGLARRARQRLLAAPAGGIPPLLRRRSRALLSGEAGAASSRGATRVALRSSI